MTPLELNILLHYHCRADQYPDMHYPALQEALERFVCEGYLNTDTSLTDEPLKTIKYHPTEKLHAFCEALQRVPEPKLAWVVDNYAAKK